MGILTNLIEKAKNMSEEEYEQLYEEAKAYKDIAVLGLNKSKEILYGYSEHVFVSVNTYFDDSFTDSLSCTYSDEITKDYFNIPQANGNIGGIFMSKTFVSNIAEKSDDYVETEEKLLMAA